MIDDWIGSDIGQLSRTTHKGRRVPRNLPRMSNTLQPPSNKVAWLQNITQEILAENDTRQENKLVSVDAVELHFAGA